MRAVAFVVKVPNDVKSACDAPPLATRKFPNAPIVVLTATRLFAEPSFAEVSTARLANVRGKNSANIVPSVWLYQELSNTLVAVLVLTSAARVTVDAAVGMYELAVDAVSS
jgi:hypothetical protein